MVMIDDYIIRITVVPAIKIFKNITNNITIILLIWNTVYY